MHVRTALAAAAVAFAAAAASSPASASLIGDQMNITITHTGVAGMTVGPAVMNHTYGGVPNTFVNGFFGTFVVASPASAPGYQNAILVDFTNFNYSGFANNTGTIAITGIAEDVAGGSIAIFAGSVGMGANIASAVGNSGGSLTASWATNSVWTPSPTTPDSFVLAWNSSPVPAPGAVALLGAAGLTARRRRANA